MEIRVPATTANLGPGFDSCGLALNLYLTLEIVEKSNQWEIEHSIANLPKDASNLIIQTALSLVPDLPPHRLKMVTDIPTTRGLGSSSSAIVAGIELANILGDLNLSSEEKITIATKLEGHPDNVAPAILGELVIASYNEGRVMSVRSEFPESDIIVVIPDHELATSESRQVLPKNLPYSEGVAASSIANVMIASLVKGDMRLAGEMMMKDRWHEHYREKLVPLLTEIKALKEKFDFYGAVLSGAGPTVIIFVPKAESSRLYSYLSETYGDAGSIKKLSVDSKGVSVKK